MLSLTQSSTWKKLERQAKLYKNHSVPNGYQNRLKMYHSANDRILLNYSDQHIDNDILDQLLTLAEECHLEEKINDLMTGHIVNNSEHKPALHTALRSLGNEEIIVDDHDIVPDILQVRQQMQSISSQIRQGEWTGYSGKAITDIVNIGIGGSTLGPRFCISALIDFKTTAIEFHFISGIDPNEFKRVVSPLNPETTLFIVASKSFVTKETLYNMDKAILWLNQPKHIDKHIIAVTAKTKKAQALGIRHILPMWNWVGGRYSSCSSINLITCIAIGYDHFYDMLSGAHDMDEHFLHEKFAKNLPVLLAMLGVWNINFLNIHNLLMLIYPYDLEQFIPYIQQVDMESNGKSMDNEGRLVNYATGPIVWGGLANQVQHSYFQLLCEGTHQVTADLISIHKNDKRLNKLCDKHHRALSNGVNKGNGFSKNSMNIPTNHITLLDCTPKSIGALMALYEHKIFSQSVIWNINAFDQPGVELFKQIIGKII